MKHRTNKNQKERVVVFLASEISGSQDNLLTIAKQFRRNGTNLDIVNVCCPSNKQIIEKMMDIVNVEDKSNFLNYEGGMTLLVDSLKSSPIMNNIGAIGQLPNNDYMDEELQMVLRISLEEEQKRQ